MSLELIFPANPASLPAVNRLSRFEATMWRKTNLMQRGGSLRAERRMSP